MHVLHILWICQVIMSQGDIKAIVPKILKEFIRQLSVSFNNERGLEELWMRWQPSISESLSDYEPYFFVRRNRGSHPCREFVATFRFSLEVEYMHVSRYRGKSSGGRALVEGNTNYVFKRANSCGGR